jgi:hypothetical protein
MVLLPSSPLLQEFSFVSLTFEIYSGIIQDYTPPIDLISSSELVERLSVCARPETPGSVSVDDDDDDDDDGPFEHDLPRNESSVSQLYNNLPRNDSSVSQPDNDPPGASEGVSPGSEDPSGLFAFPTACQDQPDQPDNQSSDIIMYPNGVAHGHLSSGVPLKQGYLSKKSRSGNSWTKRYFRLELGVIFYFASEKKTKIKGSLVLHASTAVTMYDKKPFAFSIAQPTMEKKVNSNRNSATHNGFKVSAATSTTFKRSSSTPNNSSIKTPDSAAASINHSSEMARCCFTKPTPPSHPTFVLQAQSEEERLNWVRAIEQSIVMHCT